MAEGSASKGSNGRVQPWATPFSRFLGVHSDQTNLVHTQGGQWLVSWLLEASMKDASADGGLESTLSAYAAGTALRRSRTVSLAMVCLSSASWDVANVRG